MAYSKVTGLLAAVLLSGTIICSAGAVRAADKVEAPEEYLDWLDDLKEEMIDRGISKKTIKMKANNEKKCSVYLKKILKKMILYLSLWRG